MMVDVETMASVIDWKKVNLDQNIELWIRDARASKRRGALRSARTPGGGFWNETYSRRGDTEAVYVDMPSIGFGRFAPSRAPVGAFMTSAQRLNTGCSVSGVV